MAKPKLIETYRQFEYVDRFMKMAQKTKKTKPSTRKLRIVFARLFEENELMRIVCQKAMATPGADRSNLFNKITTREGTDILTASIHGAQCSAKIMVQRLEKAAGERGYCIDVLNTTKDEIRKLAGFACFMVDCIRPKIVPVRVFREDNKESQPLLFSPNIILVQEKEGPVEFVYNPYTNFSYVLKGLAFR